MRTVIIIGGGISGLGIAAEAAKRGHKVLLFERDRCGNGTSANSLRIIHGGFRYLQSLNFIRVFGSIRAQTELLSAYPDLIVPLPCLMPLTRGGLRSYSVMRCAAEIYRLSQRLASSKVGSVGVWTPAQLAAQAPEFAHYMPNGALHWTDALLLDPQALIQREIKRAISHGTEIREFSCVTAIERVGAKWQVTFSSANKQEQVESDYVINAAGPWLNYKISKNFVELPDFAGMQWCLAFNVVVKRCLSAKWALGIRSKQGRLFFAVPRVLSDGQLGTAIGTAYIPVDGSQSIPMVPTQELAAFVSQFNSAHPEAGLSEDDIASVESGFLPMRRMAPNGPILYGSEQFRQKGGYIEVLSTKYTTYRTQASKVLSSIY